MKAAATGGRSVPHQDALVGRRDGQPGRGAFVSNSRLLDTAAIGRRRSVGIGEGAKPARRPLHDRGCGPARAVENRCASAGESAAENPAEIDLPQLCPLAGGRHWPGVGGPGAAQVSSPALGASWSRCVTEGLASVCWICAVASRRHPWRVRRGRLSHRRHLSCVHGGIPSRGRLRRSSGRTACTLRDRQFGQPLGWRRLRRCEPRGRLSLLWGPGRRRAPLPRRSWPGQ
jgi:hypothetical protein